MAIGDRLYLPARPKPVTQSDLMPYSEPAQSALHASGWHVSHNAIKVDMNTFAEAIAALEKTVAASEPLAAWQVRRTTRSSQRQATAEDCAAIVMHCS